MTENQQLFLRVQEGNEQAFNQLYNRLWEPLYLAAYKVLREEHTSQDVVQEIFIDLWRKKDTTAILNIDAYLFKAVKYRVLMLLRQGKYRELHQEVVDTIELTNNTEEHIFLQDLELAYQEITNSLPERCREIFYMSRHQNFSNHEIAEKLNLSVRTVEKQISKALKQLRYLKETIILLGLFISPFLLL
jgi:RNA polymerase sigma-70 factor (family 1)